MISTDPISLASADPSTTNCKAVCESSRRSGRWATVVVVGPAGSATGGMATVVRQNMSLDGDGVRTILFPTTHRGRESETWPERVLRHGVQWRRLRAILRESRARIVHVHTCSGFSFWRSALDMMAARRIGARVILHVHGAAFDEFGRRLPGIGRRALSRVLKRADRVVALSAGWRESLRRLSPQARIEIIENAVEVPGRPPIRRHSDPVRLSFLSRMDQWKGVDDLLDACERLTTKSARFELSLAGPPGSAGDAKLFLEKIRRRGLDPFVHYVGERHGDDKSEFLRRADVFIQPSHHEGMPLAMLEAMSHGLPVIATKVGAIPEMITHGVHGLLVAPHRPEQLAEAIAVLVGDGDLRERMSQAARALVETRFSLRRWRADLARLYEELA